MTECSDNYTEKTGRMYVCGCGCTYVCVDVCVQECMQGRQAGREAGKRYDSTRSICIKIFCSVYGENRPT
jgi:hypothetical protein